MTGIASLFKRCIELGFTIMIQTDSESDFIASICHKSWETSDLYQSRILPTWRGTSLPDIEERIDTWLDEWEEIEGVIR